MHQYTFKQQTFVRIIILLLFFAATIRTAYSTEQASTDTSKIHYLNEVEIVRQKPTKEVIAAQKLAGNEIEKLSCQSVADAIRYFSGVQIKDFGGIGGLKTIDIRSMGTNQMGVFYDGIQLGNAQNGQVDLGRFSLDNMESINLYNGQKSSILQSAKDYGSAGSIYLETKKPDFPDQEKYNLSATFKTGSFGLINPSILFQHQLNKNINTSLSAEYTDANGKYKFRHRKVNADGTTAYDTVAIRENADIEALRTEAAIFGNIRNGEWKAMLYNYASERGLPGYVARNLYEHEQRQWDNNFFLQTSVKKEIGRYSFLANGKYANDYTHYLNADTTLQYVNNHYHQQEIYVSAANAYSIFSWWEMALSGDFQWNTLDADLNDFAYPSRYTELVALASNFKFPHLKIQSSTLGSFIQEETQQGQASNPTNIITPAVIISVRPWLNYPFDIQAFYKKIFRMPTFNDLYYTVIGNSLLKPEYVTQYNIGISHLCYRPKNILRSLDVQINTYFNKVKDKIIAVPTANPFRWQMTNLGIVQIIGTDVSVKSAFVLSKTWQASLRLCYTFQKAQDFTDPSEDYYGDQIPYIPVHSGSAIANASYKTWNFNYSFIYTGERYNASANILENYVQPWYTHDVSLSKDFVWQKIKFTASTEVNNLLNQQYDVVLNYPMPGRNFKLILKINLPIKENKL